MYHRFWRADPRDIAEGVVIHKISRSVRRYELHLQVCRRFVGVLEEIVPHHKIVDCIRAVRIDDHACLPDLIGALTTVMITASIMQARVPFDHDVLNIRSLWCCASILKEL